MSTPSKTNHQATTQPKSTSPQTQTTLPLLDLKMRCFEAITRFMPVADLERMTQRAQQVYQWLVKGDKE